MDGLKARVKNGRLVLDVPTSLPEGTEIDLVVAHEGDDLDDADRAALHASLARGLAQADAGLTRPASDLLEALRRQK